MINTNISDDFLIKGVHIYFSWACLDFFPTLNICDIFSGTSLSDWSLLLCNMKAFMHLKCTDCCLAEIEIKLHVLT